MKTKRITARCSRSQSHRRFTIGSPGALVVRIQGKPDSIARYGFLGYEVWRYGDDTVEISTRTGRVNKWTNFGKRLHVSWPVGSDVTNCNAFTEGSSRDDVIRLQGTPDGIERLQGLEVLHYGDAFVELALPAHRVRAWKNSRHILRVTMLPGEYATRRSTISIGSSRDDVVRLLGTPERIQIFDPLGHQLWHYGNAVVAISTGSGRVIDWSISRPK